MTRRRDTIILLATMFVVAGAFVRAYSDDYVEDVYFWPSAPLTDTQGRVVPHFNAKAKEIIFIEDSLTAQHPDTVRAIIRERHEQR